MARAHQWNRVAGVGGVAGMLAAAAVTGFAGGGLLLPTMFVAGAALLAFAHSMGAGARSGDARERDRLRERVRKAKDELLSQRAQAEALANGLEEALFICDARGVIVFANQPALALFGFDSAEGMNILAVTLSHDIERLVAEVAQSGGVQRREMELHLAERRTVAAKAWSCPGEQVLVVVQDLTDLRRLERVRRDFVSNVSHELRSPLSVIRAIAETLQDDPEAETLMEGYLAKIVSEVDRLTTISNDLLVLSGAESRPVELQECDLAGVFRSIVEQLQPKAVSKKLALTYAGPKHCVIQANVTQMNQIAANLIENALNYTSEGRVDVSLEELPNAVRISVRDTGIGIATDHQDRIWERFYRVDKGRSRQTGGTGLGLSIVKHLVEAHGGSVSVASELNVGSTFTVRLPVEEPANPLHLSRAD